jgi:hypothetical protein
MHRTLKAEAMIPPSSSALAQQRRCDAFREQYNSIRPHESLGMQTPASLYTNSPRPMPPKLPPIEYPPHFERCFVNHSGVIYRQNSAVYIGYLLKGETVGLEAIADGVWDVYIGPIKLGRYAMEVGKLITANPRPKWKRRISKCNPST